MLTENELKWLKSREKWLKERGAYSCRWCPYQWEDGKYSLEIIKSKTCSMFDGYTDYKDAAKFEAQVAAKLSDSCWYRYVKWDTPIKLNLSLFQRSEDRLKQARIEVEKEMDNCSVF